MSANHTNRVFPVFALLFGATMWGIIWYPLRLLEQQGLAGLWATGIIYLAALLVGLLLCWRHYREFAHCPWTLLLIGVANGWCNIAFFLAVLDGSVVRVLLLFYLSPLWASLLGFLFLGERMSRQSLVTLLLAMVGAFIILWDPELTAPWPKDQADWYAITSGFSFAVSNVLVRKAQEVSVQTKTAATWLGVTLLAGIFILVTGSPLPQVGAGVVLSAVLLGVVAIVSMTFAVQYGVTHMPVYRSAVILLFEVLVGAVSSLLLSDDVVTLSEWIGGALVLLAAYLSARSHLEESHAGNHQAPAC